MAAVSGDESGDDCDVSVARTYFERAVAEADEDAGDPRAWKREERERELKMKMQMMREKQGKENDQLAIACTYAAISRARAVLAEVLVAYATFLREHSVDSGA